MFEGLVGGSADHSPLAFHQGEQGSIPRRITPGFSHVEIGQDDAAARLVFSEISRFPRPLIPAFLRTHIKHPHRLSRPRYLDPSKFLHSLTHSVSVMQFIAPQLMVQGFLGSSPGQGRMEIPEETRRPAASPATIPTYENPGATLPGIEPGSPWWDKTVQECKDRGKWEYPEKTCRHEPSSNTIPICENPGANPPGIKPGSPWWEASALAHAPPLPLLKIEICFPQARLPAVPGDRCREQYSTGRSCAPVQQCTASVNEFATSRVRCIVVT
ncbi:hypothetical protein PR048_012492 [Dryococelus australis]|uniref:Uncharacterized protein n=1 Tax=Dryococelus australis TaxID=614101 RepID=A0ABQ9HQX8_9NEOP|nr:hypothetical protein PR048_012492 [Dryococelus australis]